MPVKNYSPALLEVFKVGSEKPFEFDCKTKKAAFALQWRLHGLRREMRKEKHWLTPVAESVVISIIGTKIRAAPPDSAIEDELKKALNEHSPRPLSLLPEKLTEASPIENYLNKGKKL